MEQKMEAISLLENKTKQQDNNEPIEGIMKLPRSIQLNCLDYMSATALSALRESSNYFYRFVNDYVRRTYFKAGSDENPDELQLALHKSLDIIGSIFINAGYGDTFSGALLPLITKSRFNLTLDYKKDCLKNFLTYMYTILAKDQIQKFQLLLTMCILKYLKKSKNAELIRFQKRRAKLCVRIKLSGAWCGIIGYYPHLLSYPHNTKKSTSLKNLYTRENSISFLVILSDIFANAQKGEGELKRIWHTDTELYVYGHRNMNSITDGKIPNTAVFITITGHLNTVNFLYRWIKADCSDVVGRENLPTGDFELVLNCNSYGTPELDYALNYSTSLDLCSSSNPEEN